MSVANEDPNILPPVTPSSPILPPQEKVLLICAICHSTITDGDTKLTCRNKNCGKLVCAACIQVMLRLLFAQPALNYPLKCGGCRHSFQETQIDEVLVEQGQYEQYIACVLPLFWSDDCLEENEQLTQCPFCPYCEIHTTDACSVDFLTCQNPLCRKRSCLICLHAITDDNDEAIHRAQCIELRSFRNLIDKAIETGSKQRCPDCELAGLKDDGCTHMTCQRCGTTWCYLCGMKEEECLVDDDAEPSFSAHNQDWEKHQGRCPMYLISIKEIDDRWPDNDQDCVEYFHRYRTLCQLYEVLKIIGEDKLDELNDNFGLINATGYTIEEIQDYEDRILINYSTQDDE